MSDNEWLRIRGASEHNLKNIDVDIPRYKLNVITGLSGSGKSSLAFDTIFAEGQRRYMESLSSYARMFLGQMEKPEVESIEGLSPAISIDQKTTNRNPRSTVGTVTEIYDYLRLLYARIGIPHCPQCGRIISRQSVDQMVDRIMSLSEGTKLELLAPVVEGKKGTHAKVLEKAKKSGYVRAYIDGSLYSLDEEIELDKNIKHTIEIVVDRLKVKPDMQSRLTDSCETVLQQSEGLLTVLIYDNEDPNKTEKLMFSQHLACPECGISVPELEPRIFSFNNPYGACPHCLGIGFMREIDPDLIIPDATLSLNQGAITAPGFGSIAQEDSYTGKVFAVLTKRYGFSMDTPYCELPENIRNIIMFGDKNGKPFQIDYVGRFGERHYPMVYEGIYNILKRRFNETPENYREEWEPFLETTVCPECNGLRLRPEALAVTVSGYPITKMTDMSIRDAVTFFNDIQLSEREELIGHQILKEIRARLNFLFNVGLGYLTLSRTAGSLSGGEAQRIRLATQIGSGLSGVMYILDEPSIGLHQRDNCKLIEALKNLRNLGNTLIVVEHDQEMMENADYIVDIGPCAGIHGGQVVAAGTPQEIMKHPDSITGAFLSGRRRILIPSKRRHTGYNWLSLNNVYINNIKGQSFRIPLNVFTCVTGVSGSGKSSFVNETLYPILARRLNRSKIKANPNVELLGDEVLDKVIVIDQSPIGRSPRSNPATYTGLFDIIRDVFASTNDAKMRGYSKGRFSFNVKNGRCESCSGDGIIKIEMHFLPDVYVPCEVCKGKRYNRETLEVKYKGKNIADVLDMTVEEALSFFENVPKIVPKLQTLYDVGLSYIKLGQPSTTLSGGEAQRVKLATELSKRATGRTFYILDEPTTGLHFDDVDKLISILQKLTDNGNSVLVIEHNLDVIKTADYIIDMGPEGGDQGGMVIASGTPEEVALVEGSYTGQFLKKVFSKEK